VHVDLVDQYHHRSSAIHRHDPRVKVLLALLFVLTVSLTPQGAWAAFAALLALVLAGAWTARLGLSFTLRRSIVALPFILAALAIPFVTPGPVVFEIPFLGWTASAPGLERFVSILLRTWLAVVGVHDWFHVPLSLRAGRRGAAHDTRPRCQEPAYAACSQAFTALAGACGGFHGWQPFLAFIGTE